MKRRAAFARMLLALGSLATAQAGALPPATAEGTLSLGTTPTYSEGNYGASTTTRVRYLPVFLKYETERVSLKLTVPYLSVTGTGALISDGTVIGGPGNGTPPPWAQAQGRRQGDPLSLTTESGLGDVVIEARYRRQAGDSLDFVPYARVKLGTASREQGLGTGENDYEAGIGLNGRIRTGIFPFVSAGYRFMGDPTGIDLRNVAVYDGGVMLKLGSRTFLTVMYAGSQAVVAGSPRPSDLIVDCSYAYTAATRLRVFLDKGLSDGSPRYAVGVGVETRL